jgi:hypothetical protein
MFRTRTAGTSSSRGGKKQKSSGASSSKHKLLRRGFPRELVLLDLSRVLVESVMPLRVRASQTIPLYGTPWLEAAEVKG